MDCPLHFQQSLAGFTQSLAHTDDRNKWRCDSQTAVWHPQGQIKKISTSCFQKKPLWKLTKMLAQLLSCPALDLFSVCLFFSKKNYEKKNWTEKHQSDKIHQRLSRCCISPKFCRFLMLIQSLSSCSFFENRHNLIYMYRNFIYISYVCVFTGALLVGCSIQKGEGKAIKWLSLIPSSPFIVVSSSACIPFYILGLLGASASHLLLLLLLLLCSRQALPQSPLLLPLTSPSSLSFSLLPFPVVPLCTNERHALLLLTLTVTLLLSHSLCVSTVIQFIPIFLFTVFMFGCIANQSRHPSPAQLRMDVFCWMRELSLKVGVLSVGV